MYKPTDPAIDAFLESYRPGKDKNIEASLAENSSSSTSTTNNNNNTSGVGGGSGIGSDTNSKSV